MKKCIHYLRNKKAVVNFKTANLVINKLIKVDAIYVSLFKLAKIIFQTDGNKLSKK